MSEHHQPALALEAVSVRRSGRDILHDVSLTVAPGELVALVGPNGAGKSTLLGVMSGELRPHSGRAAIFGRDIGSIRPKELARQRSILLQANTVNFPFLVSEVIQMGRNPWAGESEEGHDEVKVGWAMEHTGVSALAQRRFSELSGGEQARVSLARVLAQDTPLILLDEPTASLDLRHQDQVMRLIRQLADQGAALVVVVHDLSLAAAFADRIALISHGRVVWDSTPATVLTPERLGEVYGVEVNVVTLKGGQILVAPSRPERRPE